MPVSSPSYFPPPRGTDQIVGITAGRGQTGARVFMGGQGAGDYTTQSDLILIGDAVMSSGTPGVPLVDLNGSGSVIVGSQSLKVVNDFTAAYTGGPFDGPATSVGFNNAPLLSVGASTVMVGANIYAHMVAQALATQGANVLLGNNVLSNQTTMAFGFFENVVIGHDAWKGQAGLLEGNFNVVIGARACQAAPTGVSITESVIIGHRAGENLASSANVLIGVQCATGLQSGGSNTIIGSAANAVGTASGNTLIGQSVAIGSGSQNVFIGQNCGNNGTQISGDRNVWLGRAAGAGTSAVIAESFLVEVNTAVANPAGKLTLLYGDFVTGSLIVGNSSEGTNRDFDGGASRNILKLLNGTVGALTPIGGGYFYVSAGALHWVGSAGTNTVLAPA